MRLALLAIGLALASPALAEEKLDEVAALTLEKAALAVQLADAAKREAARNLADVQQAIINKYHLDTKAGDGIDLQKRLITRAPKAEAPAKVAAPSTPAPAKPAKRTP